MLLILWRLFKNLIVIVLIIALWETLAFTGTVTPQVLPGPWSVTLRWLAYLAPAHHYNPADDGDWLPWLVSGELIADLTAAAGPEFTRRLHTNGLPRSSRQTWRHPTVDDLRFDREPLEISAADTQQLVVLLPADETTETALTRLRRNDGLSLVK